MEAVLRVAVAGLSWGALWAADLPLQDQATLAAHLKLHISCKLTKKIIILYIDKKSDQKYYFCFLFLFQFLFQLCNFLSII